MLSKVFQAEIVTFFSQEKCRESLLTTTPFYPRIRFVAQDRHKMALTIFKSNALLPRYTGPSGHGKYTNLGCAVRCVGVDTFRDALVKFHEESAA